MPTDWQCRKSLASPPLSSEKALSFLKVQVGTSDHWTAAALEVVDLAVTKGGDYYLLSKLVTKILTTYHKRK